MNISKVRTKPTTTPTVHRMNSSACGVNKSDGSNQACGMTDWPLFPQQEQH